MKRIVPISEKCLLTLDEAAQYTGLGLQKLRDLSNDDNCNFVLWNGSKRMLKRVKLEEYLNKAYSI
ncbi:excisionase [Thomasclavelia cocleata]|uniref:excisionase n=1 Tax=Thomasclavelia cocleata TaxID=69824 RepID=UPI001559C259|nr:excisionase [Thomasclavelia cocleata]